MIEKRNLINFRDRQNESIYSVSNNIKYSPKNIGENVNVEKDFNN